MAQSGYLLPQLVNVAYIRHSSHPVGGKLQAIFFLLWDFTETARRPNAGSSVILLDSIQKWGRWVEGHFVLLHRIHSHCYQWLGAVWAGGESSAGLVKGCLGGV